MKKYTLAFDVYGTLINTSGVLTSLQKMVGDQAVVLMNTWRNKQLEYSFRHGLMDHYVDFSVCTRNALQYSCMSLKIQLSVDQQADLMKEYTVLPAFEEVPAALTRLSEAGHRLFAFSNGSHKAVHQLLLNAQLIDFFEEIVSVEEIQTFKPNPKVYHHFNEKTGAAKEDSWLISGNPFDVIGAISYGMQAAWIQRNPEMIFDPWGVEPTITVSDLSALAF